MKQRRGSGAMRISQRYSLKIPICGSDGSLVPCILHCDDLIYMDVPTTHYVVDQENATKRKEDAIMRIHAVIIDIHYDMIAKAGRIRIRILPEISSVVSGIGGTLVGNKKEDVGDDDDMPTLMISDRVVVLASSEAVRIIRPLKVTCVGEHKIEGSKAWLAYGQYAKYKRDSPITNTDPVVMRIDEIPVVKTDVYEYIETKSIVSLDEYLRSNYFTQIPPYAMIKGELDSSSPSSKTSLVQHVSTTFH